ncbi:MAG: HD-GYP domain-containing protein [Candidatus Latescibacterota bacterium]|nr:MAG: HD-GYP domain-containing protein [Candidatus Latescibacterota bacterium]
MSDRQNIEKGSDAEFFADMRNTVDAPGATDHVATDDDDVIRELGPGLVHSLFSAIKTVQVHDLGNRATQRSLTELQEHLRTLFALDSVVSLRVSPDYIHLNDVRLNIESQSYGPFTYVMEGVRERDVETIELYPEVNADECGIFLKEFFGEIPDDDVFDTVETRLSSAGVVNIKIVQWVDRERHLQAQTDEKRNIRKESTQVFFRTVLLMGEVLRGIEQRRVLRVKKAERLTQQMVDIIQTDETILLGLTSIRNFDEYTFTHSVNVCILSMLIADRLQLYKSDIARLGVAALLHDIGKTYVPQSILNKPSKLDGRDWELMKYHTFFGVKELSRIKAPREIIDGLFVALQHHVHFNGDGYPQKSDGWDLRLFSRIVTVADYYDAMTTPRIYKMDPVYPDRALRFVLSKSGQIFDPLIAKVFIQAMGLYPIGTVVELDTAERGVVVKQNEASRFIHRPMVTPVLPDGTFSAGVEPLDLSERNRNGRGFRRSIVGTIYDEVVEYEKADFFMKE